MNLQQIQERTARLTQLAQEASALEKRYVAHLSLYDAACMMGNESEMAQRRDECHTLLDDILDNTFSVHRLTRELQDLMMG